METQAAINTRRSIRDFQSLAPTSEILRAIVTDAQRAPSWANSQPWHVTIATGDTLAKFRDQFARKSAQGLRGHAELATAHRGDWSPAAQINMARWNMQVAQTLDGNTGIYQASEQRLYNAPALAILTIPKQSTAWSIYDLGAFAQTLMLAATDRGVATMPAYAFVKYPTLVHRTLQVPDDQLAAMGIALGYSDETRQINQLHTDRERTDDVLTLLD